MANIDGEITISRSGVAAYTFAPASATVELDSLATEDSGRTDDGMMHIDFVYRKIRKINISLPPLDQTDIQKILNIVQGQIYTITYRDPLIPTTDTTPAVRSTTVYTSKSSVALYSGTLKIPTSATNGIWTSGSFNAIEVSGES